jgi:pimeloyl-ACP methyl ester carboxylesterase
MWVKHWLKTYFFKANWVNKNESFAHKLERLTTIIDHAHAKGYTVSLVAASAGSSMALNALHERPDSIHRVISIVGKLKHPEAVARELYDLNPAFEDSLKASTNAEAKLTPGQRSKILVVRAMRDSYVPGSDGEVKGAHEFTMNTIGHVTSIILALTVYQRRLIRFIKNGSF